MAKLEFDIKEALEVLPPKAWIILAIGVSGFLLMTGIAIVIDSIEGHSDIAFLEKEIIEHSGPPKEHGASW